VIYGGPDESPNQMKRRSLASAPLIAQLVLVAIPVLLGCSAAPA